MTSRPSKRSQSKKWLLCASVVALCGALSACNTTQGPAPRPGAVDLVSSTSNNTGTAGDYVAQLAYWGSIYDKTPDNGEAALNYAQALRYLGRNDQAATVLSRAVALHDQDPLILAEYGKALTATGRLAEGADYLARANQRKPEDWTILTAEGVVLDRMGQHGAAQHKYENALTFSPDNPNVLNNLALSQALDGNIDGAEQILRRAVGKAQATPQMRQNLALVLGLQGNFAEARRYASADLPPPAVENNLDYFRTLVAQSSPWSALQELDQAE